MLWEISVFIFIFIKSIIGSTRDNGMLQNMGKKPIGQGFILLKL